LRPLLPNWLWSNFKTQIGGHFGPGIKVLPKNSHPRYVTLLSSNSKASIELHLSKNVHNVLTPSSSQYVFQSLILWQCGYLKLNLFIKEFNLRNCFEGFDYCFNSRPSQLFPYMKLLYRVSFFLKLFELSFNNFGYITLIFNTFFFICLPEVFHRKIFFISLFLFLVSSCFFLGCHSI